MKQDCRYCAESIGQDEDCLYCNKKDKFFSKSQSSRTNKCKDFLLNEIDALGFDLNKKYKPRKEKAEINDIQKELF